MAPTQVLVALLRTQDLRDERETDSRGEFQEALRNLLLNDQQACNNTSH